VVEGGAGHEVGKEEDDSRLATRCEDKAGWWGPHRDLMR
jgi:hypothetical protein